MAKVQVVATGRGFDNITIRNEGDVFEVPEAVARKHSSWFKPVDPKFKVEPKREPVPMGDASAELVALKAQVAQLTALLSKQTLEQVETRAADEALV